jgi:hypothetical protein
LRSPLAPGCSRGNVEGTAEDTAARFDPGGKVDMRCI